MNTIASIPRATTAGAALVFIACGPNPAEAPRAPTPEVFVGEPAPPPPPPDRLEPADPAELAPIEWETDERAAVDRARREDAPLLTFLFAEWSAASQEVDRRVFTDPSVIELAHELVMLRVDLTSEDANASLYAERYAVGQLPAIIVADGRGREPIARLEGLTEPAEVVAAMRRALDR